MSLRGHGRAYAFSVIPAVACPSWRCACGGLAPIANRIDANVLRNACGDRPPIASTPLPSSSRFARGSRTWLAAGRHTVWCSRGRSASKTRAGPVRRGRFAARLPTLAVRGRALGAGRRREPRRSSSSGEPRACPRRAARPATATPGTPRSVGRRRQHRVHRVVARRVPRAAATPPRRLVDRAQHRRDLCRVVEVRGAGGVAGAAGGRLRAPGCARSARSRARCPARDRGPRCAR